MESLINYFNHLGFREEQLSRFLGCVKEEKYAAGSLIIRPEQTENKLSFIDTGIVRYYVLVDGKEITFDFAFKNTFFTAYDSFYSRKKTKSYIETLTDCVLYSISYENLQALYKDCKTAQQLGQIATEFLLSKKVGRELSLLTQSPQQRYKVLLEEQPKYLHQIPLKYLASYLGIVPETLSRIRSRIN